MELRGEQHNPDGSVVTWRSESWQLNEARSRGVRLSSARGDSRRVLSRGDTNELYDAERDDLHRHSAGAPGRQPAQDQDRLEGPAGAADAQLRATSALKIRKSGGYSAIATKEGAERLREQRAGARDSDADGPAEEPFRAEILAPSTRDAPR